MMNHKLNVTHTNEHAERILAIIGNEVRVDECGYLELVNYDAKKIVLILGDDSWGAVTSAITAEGHLVLAANFGDDGNLFVSPTLNESAALSNDLPDEIRTQLEECTFGCEQRYHIECLGEYTIGEIFS